MRLSLLNLLKPIKAYQRFIESDNKNFRLIYYSIIVGVLVGFVGAIFRLILSYLESLRGKMYENIADAGYLNWIWIIVFSLVGISVSLFLVRRFAKETSGSGVQEIEGALDDIRILRWKRVLPIKFIASLFSLGCGLLLGREGPTIQIGGNIGKMIKDVFKLPKHMTNSFVSAGAAAGLASAFNAPLAGIIFVIEEMHGHFKHTFFTVAAIMVASGSADLVVRLFIGVAPVIKMKIYPNPELKSFWLFILLGLIFSIVGYIFNKLLIIGLDFFDGLSKIKIVISIFVLALIISLVGMFYHSFLGGGYETIRIALDKSLSLQFLLILFVGRLVLTIFSYGIGAPGGIFAPLLALGVILGMVFGSIMQSYFPDYISDPGVFAVAGMAAIFASTVRAPLTGLVLAVEMTSNFEMILPLIITTVTASVITAELGNEPIYTTLLKRGEKNLKNNNLNSKLLL